MKRTALTISAIALAMATACSEQTLNTLDDGSGANGPTIMVSPEFIDFGELEEGEVVTETFVVTNIGEELLEVSGITMGAGQTGFSLLSETLVFDLQPAEEQIIEVAYTPFGLLEQNNAVIDSNDPNTPKVMVEFLGAGLVPELAIEPNPYDYGTTYVAARAATTSPSPAWATTS